MEGLKNKTILIISTDAWGDYYLSKHHYAITLAKHNKVYFLNHANARKNKDATVASTRFDNLEVVNYYSKWRGIRYFPSFMSTKIYQKQIEEIVSVIGEKIDVVWSFDPFRFTDWKPFNADLHIFHPVDLYPSSIAEKVAQNAQIIFATSQSIIDQYESIKVPKFVLNHGIASTFFEPMTSEKEQAYDLPKGKNPLKVGYIGNLSHKHLHIKSIYKCTEDNPEIDFYFVGPKGEDRGEDAIHYEWIKALKQLPNAYFVPSVKYERLPHILSQLDVLLVCYNREKYKDAPPNPHKMLEYLSSGKVIVSNFFKSYEAHQKLIIMADSLANYPTVFKNTIDNITTHQTQELIQSRINLAQGYTYDRQIGTVEARLLEEKLI